MQAALAQAGHLHPPRGVGHFFGACDVHADRLFGGYRLAKTAAEVLAFYRSIRRRYPEHLRIYLVNDHLALHWTPRIRAWAEAHNVDLVATPTSASHLNRIECHFRPLREFVLNSSDYASHTEAAVAFRRYLHRRNADQHTSRIRLLESRPSVADTASGVRIGGSGVCESRARV